MEIIISTFKYIYIQYMEIVIFHLFTPTSKKEVKCYLLTLILLSILYIFHRLLHITTY